MHRLVTIDGAVDRSGQSTNRFAPLISYYQLACFAMSVYIGVKWNGWLPRWLIAVYVAHGLSFPVIFIMGDKREKTETELLTRVTMMVAWIVAGSFIAAAHIDCAPDSDLFQSLIPTAPYEGPSAKYVAEVKCVFAGFQLSFGAMIMFAFIVGISWDCWMSERDKHRIVMEELGPPYSFWGGPPPRSGAPIELPTRAPKMGSVPMRYGPASSR